MIHTRNAVALCLILASCLKTAADDSTLFALRRQQFPIMKDGEVTVLGAEMPVFAYPKDCTFGSLGKAGALNAQSPEFRIINQERLLSTGDIDGVVAGFAPRDKEKARKMFADPGALKRARTSLEDFRFVCKTEFGPVLRISYQTAVRNGHRLTLSSYLTKQNDDYIFLTEPDGFGVFGFCSASFPYWKPETDRGINQQDDRGLLSATFNYTESGRDSLNFSESRLVLRYKLFQAEGGPAGEASIRDFVRKFVQSCKRGDTNEIVSSWRAGFDQEYARSLALSGDMRQTVDYFRAFDDFKIDFYIAASGQFWVYLSPHPATGQLKLLRLAREGGSFKLASHFDDHFADGILSSEQMAGVLLRQAGR